MACLNDDKTTYTVMSRDEVPGKSNEWMNSIWDPALPGLMHLGLKTGPLCPVFCTKLKEPCSLAKFHMTPKPCFLMSSGSKKKEPRYVYDGGTQK